jgi:predicted PurR-regulated permease PerM
MHFFGLAGLLLGPLGISYLIELLQVYSKEYGASWTRTSAVADAAD